MPKIKRLRKKTPEQGFITEMEQIILDHGMSILTMTLRNTDPVKE